ncbi:MAG: ubiquinone/menaquinone biosynthesis methyltransferase [Burkholderiales bacterium]
MVAQVNTCRATTAEVAAALTEQGVQVQPHPWLGDCLVLSETGNLERLTAFQAGHIYIQDTAARLAVLAAGATPGMKVLDIAGGTGDLARAFARQAGPQGEVWLTDINDSMLRVGRDRLTDDGLILPLAVCDAEKLPFPDNYFDRVTVAYGLRNMTHKDRALAEMTRVLVPGGKLLVLEFSHIAKPLAPVYDWYSFKVLPWLGKKIAGDAGSYQYLAESIRMHPDQETLKAMLVAAGLSRVQYFNLTSGLTAVHEGVKLV